MVKPSHIIVVFIIASAFTMSCSEDIGECPGKMCIMAGGWRLTEVLIDDTKEASDFSQYRLVLEMPSPSTAETSRFSRVQPSGNSDDGTWSIENNETILRLRPNDDPLLTEDWIIERFTPRELVLVLNRDVSVKQGPAKIQFNLEPF